MMDAYVIPNEYDSALHELFSHGRALTLPEIAAELAQRVSLADAADISQYVDRCIADKTLLPDPASIHDEKFVMPTRPSAADASPEASVLEHVY